MGIGVNGEVAERSLKTLIEKAKKCVFFKKVGKDNTGENCPIPFSSDWNLKKEIPWAALRYFVPNFLSNGKQPCRRKIRTFARSIEPKVCSFNSRISSN
jgi:hypothetical protein